MSLHSSPIALRTFVFGAADGGPSAGLLAGVGAVVLAAVAAISSRRGSKAAAKAPKPNKIKAKIKVGFVNSCCCSYISCCAFCIYMHCSRPDK